MTASSAHDPAPVWWRIHDIVVGLLAGFGIGIVAGLFINRLLENNVVVLISGIVGAIAAIYILIQNHQATRRFLSGVVVVTWLLLVLSTAFMTLLVLAIANFE